MGKHDIANISGTAIVKENKMNSKEKKTLNILDINHLPDPDWIDCLDPC